jgi:lambda family phage portal protein
MSRYPALVSKGFKVVHQGNQYSIPQLRSNYEGASAGRRMGTWNSFASSSNSMMETSSLTTLRARTRDAVRNNPWATQALHSYAANLVGRGITPRWLLEDKALKDEIEIAFDEWTKECDADGQNDFYGMQNLVAKTVIQSGETLVRFRPRRLSDGLSVPLQLQQLEPDFLDDGKNGPAPPNGRSTYHMGIEIDGVGRRSHYWLRKQHPGDSIWMPHGYESSPVPAAQVLHVYRVDRPGQLRGVPWFAPVLARMFLLDQYEDAELDRKKTSALFVAFVKKTGDLAGPGGLIGFDNPYGDSEDQHERPFAELEPGMLNYLLPGEDVVFANPTDVGGSYDVWITRQLQAIAAGIGITYEQLTGDFSRVNFSSARGRAIEFRRQARQIIGSMINFQFNQKVAEMWLSMAVASGRIKIPDYATNRRAYTKIDWRPDGWEWVNPREDVETEKSKVRAGFKSRKSVCDEIGEDIDEIDAENIERNQFVDSNGLVYDSDPRKTSDAGLTQARPGGTKLPDPKKFGSADEKQERPNGFGNVNDQRNNEAAPAEEEDVANEA